MSTVRKAFLSAAAMFSFSTVALVATPGHAAISVVLECSFNPMPKNIHNVYEVDYDAKTVREYFVDDDGATGASLPMGYQADRTFPAQISDNEIAWTEYETGDGGYQRDRLGRYSGTLAGEKYDPNLTPSTSSWTFQCQPFAPNRQRKF